MAEYALIVTLVGVVGLAAWALLGTNITSTINNVASCITPDRHDRHDDR
jgi:Flp pilus assembly pilin Flp